MATTRGFVTGTVPQPAGTTALDTRKADAALLVPDNAATQAPRTGVLTENPSIVTSDASTAPMRVAVAKAGFATSRGVADGVTKWTNDGSVFVTITKPVSNSHYVVVYAKANDAFAGDANSLPVIEVVTGAAAGSPVEPAIPTGAEKLATILVPSTATSSQSAGVVITNVYKMTAMRGGVVPFRTKADLELWTTAAELQLAWIIASKRLAQFVGGLWQASGGVTPFADTAVTAGAIGGGAWVTIALSAPSASSEVTYSGGTPGRLTAQVKGRYRVLAAAQFVASTSGQARIRKNGTTTVSPEVVSPVTGGAAYPQVVAEVDLAVGDYIELQVVSNAGGGTLFGGLVNLAYVRATP